MTAAFSADVVEVVAAARAPKLTLVPAINPMPAPAVKKRARRPAGQPLGTGGDPLVDGAARLLSVPVRQLYAMLWRVGLLEVV